MILHKSIAHLCQMPSSRNINDVFGKIERKQMCPETAPAELRNCRYRSVRGMRHLVVVFHKPQKDHIPSNPYDRKRINFYHARNEMYEKPQAKRKRLKVLEFFKIEVNAKDQLSRQ